MSHSSKDAAAAEYIFEALEEAGLRPWLARRHIDFGHYASHIGDVIDRCRAMVVVISPDACASREVLVEVHRAFRRNKILVPVCLEAYEPTGELEQYLGPSSRIDVFGPDRHESVRALCRRLRSSLSADQAILDSLDREAPVPPFHRRASTHAVRVLAMLALALSLEGADRPNLSTTSAPSRMIVTIADFESRNQEARNDADLMSFRIERALQENAKRGVPLAIRRLHTHIPGATPGDQAEAAKALAVSQEEGPHLIIWGEVAKEKSLVVIPRMAFRRPPGRFEFQAEFEQGFISLPGTDLTTFKERLATSIGDFAGLVSAMVPLLNGSYDEAIQIAHGIKSSEARVIEGLGYYSKSLGSTSARGDVDNCLRILEESGIESRSEDGMLAISLQTMAYALIQKSNSLGDDEARPLALRAADLLDRVIRLKAGKGVAFHRIAYADAMSTQIARAAPWQDTLIRTAFRHIDEASRSATPGGQDPEWTASQLVYLGLKSLEVQRRPADANDLQALVATGRSLAAIEEVKTSQHYRSYVAMVRAGHLLVLSYRCLPTAAKPLLDEAQRVLGTIELESLSTFNRKYVELLSGQIQKGAAPLGRRTESRLERVRG